MKILIVEDEPSLRELIQRSLEKERYVVETAGDFNSALCKITTMIVSYWILCCRMGVALNFSNA